MTFRFSFACFCVAGATCAAACSTGADDLVGSKKGPADAGVPDASTPDVAADGPAVPAACGALVIAADGTYTSGALHGRPWTSVNPESTISDIGFGPGGYCVKGQVVAPANNGYSWAILALEPNTVLRIPVTATATLDAGADAGDASDAGLTDAEAPEAGALDASEPDAGAPQPLAVWNTIVPTSDGIYIHVTQNGTSAPLVVCAIGANNHQYCTPYQADFIPWGSFDDDFGSGLAYARQPITSVDVVVPSAPPGQPTAFDFCLTSLVEAASWCGCSGNACTCPAGTVACDKTCVGTSVDPNHCGGCDLTCGPSSACAGGQCLAPIAGGPSYPDGIATSAGDVYWTDYNAGTVNRAGADGGAPTPIASQQGGPYAVALDATSVYWVNIGTAASSGTVMRALRSGASPQPIAMNEPAPVDIAVDAKNVYWLDEGTSAAQYTDGALHVMPLSGGPQPPPLITGLKNPLHLVIDAQNAYWSETATRASDGMVRSIPLSGGGQVVTIATGQEFPYDVAVDGSSVYWTNFNGGTVMKAPIGGGTAVTLAPSEAEPRDIIVAGGNVYWTGSWAGALRRVSAAGGTPVTLAAGQTYSQGIAADATFVYWTTRDFAGSGGVLRSPL
jgi:hypothetical protein